MLENLWKKYCNMKKIVFYIQTSTMISYFVEPIVGYLKKNYEIHLFHIDSINDVKEPREFHDIIKHDIGNLSVVKTKKLIHDLNPQCIILINIYSMVELFVLRLAKELGYKTIFLQHGVFEMSAAKKKYDKLIKNTISELIKLVLFCAKYISFIIHSNAPLKECRLFYSAFFKRDFHQTKFDKAIFFAPFWADMMNDKFGYDGEQIEYCGYPLAITNEEYITLINKKEKKLNKAIYIHQPFIQDKLTSYTYEEEKLYICKVAKKLFRYGLRLDLPLHPGENLEYYKQMYVDEGIRVIQNIKKEEYAKYKMAIGFYSTALFIPIRLHIPIWIIDYDHIHAKDSIFYPLSVDIEDESTFMNDSEIEEFVTAKIGKDKGSMENIATKINDCINQLKK